MDKAEINIRDANDDDVAFITSTWLRYFKNSSYFAKRITKTIYYKYHHKLVERILKDPATKTLVAVLIDDPTTILGYIVLNPEIDGRPPVIQFTYVKGSFRKMGIGSQLIERSKIDMTKAHFTHWTYDADELTKKYLMLTFNPYLV